MANRIDKLLKHINSANDINDRIQSLLELTIDDINFIKDNDKMRKNLQIGVWIFVVLLGDPNISSKHKAKFIMDYVKSNKTEESSQPNNVLKLEFIDTAKFKKERIHSKSRVTDKQIKEKDNKNEHNKLEIKWQ